MYYIHRTQISVYAVITINILLAAKPLYNNFLISSKQVYIQIITYWQLYNKKGDCSPATLVDTLTL